MHNNIAIKYLVITCIFIVVCVVNHADAEMLPSGLQQWYDTETGEGITQRGGLIHNYQQDDSTWKPIDNTWKEMNDSVYMNTSDVFRTYVTDNGRIQIRASFGGHQYIIDQQLERLVFIDTLNFDYMDIQTDLQWNEPILIDSVSLRWNFYKWGVQVTKGNGAVGTQVFFKPEGIDSIIEWWQALPISEYRKQRIALGNVTKFVVRKDGVVLPDSVFFNDSCTVWKQIAKHAKRIFGLSRQVLHIGRTGLQIPRFGLSQHWTTRYSGVRLCEHIPVNQLESAHQAFPDSVLWHAATTTFNYLQMQDTYINANLAEQCFNYGNADYLSVRDNFGALDHRGLIRPLDVADNIGAGQIIDSGEVWYYTAKAVLGGNIEDDSIGIYECLKPFIEGNKDGEELEIGEYGALYPHWGGVWNLRGCANGNFWADPFADCARDAGEYNDNNFADQDCVDSTADRKETPEDMIYVDEPATWYKWRISGELATGWYDSTRTGEDPYTNDIQPCGFVMITQGTGENKFLSSSYSWTPNSIPELPYYKFYHRDEAPPDVRHSPDGPGVRHSPSGVSVRHRP